MRVSVISSTCYIDFDGWRVVVSRKKEGEEEQKEEAVEITQPQMYKLLEFFAEHPGEYISKKTLLKECWGIELEEKDTGSGFDNTLRPQISNCRKLDEELRAAIETMPGGYCYKGRKITDGCSKASALDMTDVQGFCIGDVDHSGCQIRRDESGPKATAAEIDFSLTDSDLCSVVYYIGGRDWSQLAADHKLCFEVRAVPGPVRAGVEVRLRGRDFSRPVKLQEELGTCAVPMKELASPGMWEEVQELHILFYRRATPDRTAVTIENLRLEG
ncbi:MAG: helix-turn-helix domain-containing protein [Ruminococcus flavefaciens]|nr:helix-turn-helix domain-containing protein [Ruminococcus flavefaciens]